MTLRILYDRDAEGYEFCRVCGKIFGLRILFVVYDTKEPYHEYEGPTYHCIDCFTLNPDLLFMRQEYHRITNSIERDNKRREWDNE